MNKQNSSCEIQVWKYWESVLNKYKNETLVCDS